MNVQLDERLYMRFKTIKWFSACGVRDNLGLPVMWISSWEDALQLLQSLEWADIRTEAQGDLTGYLARHHAAVYGGVWNRLAGESRARIESEIVPAIRAALDFKGWGGGAIENSICFDLNRIAIEAAYKRRFPTVPSFFDKLMTVYEKGHVPCGYTGDLSHGAFHTY